MRKFLFIFFVLFSVTLLAQDPATSYTSHIHLGQWATGSNPGATALNNQWSIIDSAAYAIDTAAVKKWQNTIFVGGLTLSGGLSVGTSQYFTGGSGIYMGGVQKMDYSGNLPSTEHISNSGIWAQGTISQSKYGFGGAVHLILTGNSATFGSTARTGADSVYAGYLTLSGAVISGIWQGTSISTAYTDAKVTSVAGRTGAVTLTTSDIAEGTNLYYTDARARASISETVTGLTYTSGTGVLSLSAGYVIPTTTEETNWNDAYSKRVDTWNAPLSFSTNAVSFGYNSTNLKLTTNQLNTIQNIADTSSPTFNLPNFTGGLKINGSTLSDASRNLTTGTISSGAVTSTATTEQLRLRYDASNYASLTVGVTGSLTLGLTGTGQSISFANTGTNSFAGNISMSSGKSLYNNFTSGILGSGYNLNYNGTTSNLELDNLTIRNTLRTHIFQKDVVKVTNGYLYVSDAGVVSSNTSSTIVFQTDKSASFSSGDTLWVKDANSTTGTISSIKIAITSNGTSAGDSTSYSCTYPSGTYSDIQPGMTAARISGGTILLDASSTYSPFIDIANSGTVYTRLGNLAGKTSSVFGQLNGYGLWGQNIYAEGNVNISGTLTAGDENGFGNTFYVGATNTNLKANSDNSSMSVDYWTNSGSLSYNAYQTSFYPVGFDGAFRLKHSDGTGNLYEWLGDITPGTLAYGMSWEPNTEYTLSCWVWTNHSTQTYNMDAWDVVTSAHIYSGNVSYTLEPYVWKRVSITFTTPIFDAFRVHWGLYNTPMGTSDFYMTGLQVNKGKIKPYQKTDGTIYEQNRIAEWNFDANVTGWTGYQSTIAWDASGQNGGGMKCTVTSTSNLDQKANSDVTLLAGKYYRIRFWYKNMQSAVSYGILFSNSWAVDPSDPNQILVSYSDINSNLGTWKYVDIVVLAKNSGNFSFWYAGVPLSGIIYFDGITINEVSQEEYRMWAIAGGFGGTMQNPVIGLSDAGLFVKQAGYTTNVSGSGTYIGNFTSTTGFYGTILNEHGLFGYQNNSQVFRIDTAGAKIANFNISTDNISTGAYNTSGTLYFGSSGLSLSNTFSVSSAGVLTATGANISGAITATSGTFTGTVNASGGNFTGYVTAGTSRFGASVQTGKNGMWLNASNYLYDDGSFQLGGSTGITYAGSGNVTVGSNTAFSGSITSTATITGGAFQTASTGNKRFILDTNGLTQTASTSETVLQMYSTYYDSKWHIDRVIKTNSKIATTLIRELDGLGNPIEMTDLTYDGSLLSSSGKYYGIQVKFGGTVYFGGTADSSGSGIKNVTNYYVTTDGAANLASLTTSNPGNGSGTWLLGKYITPGGVALTIDPNHYVEVKIDGTVYKIALAN